MHDPQNKYCDGNSDYTSFTSLVYCILDSSLLFSSFTAGCIGLCAINIASLSVSTQHFFMKQRKNLSTLYDVTNVDFNKVFHNINELSFHLNKCHENNFENSPYYSGELFSALQLASERVLFEEDDQEEDQEEDQEDGQEDGQEEDQEDGQEEDQEEDEEEDQEEEDNNNRSVNIVTEYDETESVNNVDDDNCEEDKRTRNFHMATPKRVKRLSIQEIRKQNILDKTNTESVNNVDDDNCEERWRSCFDKPTRISDEMANFLGVEHGTEMARTAVSKEIHRYVEKYNLKQEGNGRYFRADAKLVKLLNYHYKGDDDKLKLGYFNLQKYMKHHFQKAGDAAIAA